MCDGHDEAPRKVHTRRRLFGVGAAALALWPLRRHVAPDRPPTRRLPGPRPPSAPTRTARNRATPPPPEPPPAPPVTAPPVAPPAGPSATSPPYGTPVPNRTITIPLPELPLGVPQGWAEQVLGSSHQGRPVQLLVHHPAGEPRARVLVVTCIHGNELGTVPIAERLLSVPIPEGVLVAVLPALNPDGWATQSRNNGAEVDLNRNFPWRWSAWDGGPAPASEPETQAVMGLIQSNPWDLTVWIHQPLGYVAAVPPTDPVYSEAWRGAAGLPDRADLDQHGGGETWTTKVAGIASILVEVDTHDATEAMVEAHAAGFAATLALFA
jgi:protein MpaA